MVSTSYTLYTFSVKIFNNMDLDSDDMDIPLNLIEWMRGIYISNIIINNILFNLEFFYLECNIKALFEYLNIYRGLKNKIINHFDT
jgi:hypothetical protein